MHCIHRFVVAALVAAFALPLLPAPAAAQSAEGIEEIVVTARKREESLQDTPLSITAITGVEIEARGIETFSDANALAPNLMFLETAGSSANIGASLRGVANGEPQLTADSGIAIYLDDAYIARAAGAAFDLVDLQRIEILRGPQGTLYGRNATGGAIKFISRKPGDEFGWKQKFTYGSFEQFHSRTSVDTGEFMPGWRATATFLYKQRDGYVDNTRARSKDDPGAYKNHAGRVAITWDANENLHASYAFDYANMNGSSAVPQLFGVTPAATGGLAGVLAAAGINLQMGEERMETLQLDEPSLEDWRIRGHNLTLTFDLNDDVTLKSITTFREWENRVLGNDLDGNAPFDIPEAFALNGFRTNLAMGRVVTIPGGVQNVGIFNARNRRTQEQWTEELQLLWSATEQLDITAGAYYFKEEFTERNQQQFLVGLPPIPRLLPQGGFLVFHPNAGTAMGLRYDGENSAFAGYLSLDYQFTDQIEASVGVRHTSDDREFIRLNDFPAPVIGKDDWSNVDWHASLSYAINDEMNVYGRAATAYKAGGFNIRTQGPAAARPYDEETMLSYELGYKGLLLDGRLQLNLAAFYVTYEDLQTQAFSAGAGGATSTTINAGEATIQGVELETRALLTENLSVYLNYGLQDMEYDEYTLYDPGNPRNPTAMPGNYNAADRSFFGLRPESNLAGGWEFQTPVGGEGAELSLRMDARWTDEITFYPTPGRHPSGAPGLPFSACTPGFACISEDGYVLVDARVSFSQIPFSNGITATLSAWGRNVFDEEYVLHAIDFGALGFGVGRFGEPATYGIDLTFEY